jgi:hypothetical protein
MHWNRAGSISKVLVAVGVSSLLALASLATALASNGPGPWP